MVSDDPLESIVWHNDGCEFVQLPAAVAEFVRSRLTQFPAMPNTREAVHVTRVVLGRAGARGPQAVVQGIALVNEKRRQPVTFGLGLVPDDVPLGTWHRARGFNCPEVSEG